MAEPMFPKPEGGDLNRGSAVIATYWSITAVATIVIALRFYSRRIIHATGADDWLMLVGLGRTHPKF